MSQQPSTPSEQQTGPPPRLRWLKVLLIGIAVAVLLFLALHLLMGGGPGMHGPGGA